MSVEGAAVSLGATILSVAFAFLVLRQWLAKRRPYQLAWSVGLGLYGLAAFAQFFAEAFGWSAPLYKLYYLVAAPLVAVLGIGSTFLVHRRAGIGFSLYAAVLFVGFLLAILAAPVNTAAFASAIPVAGTALPDNVRIFSPLFTIPGSIALIGIAAYSYWKTRLLFNLWIGLGALIVAAGGSLARYNLPWALYIGEFLGIAVMFWGFLASQDIAKARAPAPAQIPS
ncbi:MAG TPA: hypothetical protein VEO20_10070 [Thermoplasmata archaeon]|nr:hypothetical protein [Thermoplasmata archaeon]